MAFPTDARLYHKMRLALVRRARQLGIPLRQNYRFKSQQLLARQGRYAHARQMKRAAKMTRGLKTILGRVLRDIQRKARTIQGPIVDEPLGELVALAERCSLKHAPANTSSTACMLPRWNALPKAKRTALRVRLQGQRSHDQQEQLDRRRPRSRRQSLRRTHAQRCDRTSGTPYRPLAPGRDGG